MRKGAGRSRAGGAENVCELHLTVAEFVDRIMQHVEMIQKINASWKIPADLLVRPYRVATKAA